MPIAATPQKVYNTMLNSETYSIWTTPFNANSRFEGSWQPGSTMHFIGCDDDGEESGMISRINENIPGQFVSIQHLGFLRGNEEVLSGAEVDDWKGALENYRFLQQNGQTLLEIEMDAKPEWEAYFTDIWPKALEHLKQLCEQ